jgi:hypothetical protein
LATAVKFKLLPPLCLPTVTTSTTNSFTPNTVAVVAKKKAIEALRMRKVRIATTTATISAIAETICIVDSA